MLGLLVVLFGELYENKYPENLWLKQRITGGVYNLEVPMMLLDIYLGE